MLTGRVATVPPIGSSASLLETISAELRKLKYVNSVLDLREKMRWRTDQPVEALGPDGVLAAVAEVFALDVHVWVFVKDHTHVSLKHLHVYMPSEQRAASRPRLRDRPGSVERVDVVQHGDPPSKWSGIEEVWKV